MAAEYLPVNLSERVQARLLSQVGENIKDILDSTRENVQLHISEGMAAGDGAAQLGDRVEQAGAFSELRAETIARTETATLLNRAAMASYREFGVTHVEVIDGDDDEECAAANGQTWTLEEAEANPIEHPNCVRDFSPIIGEPAETPEDAAPAEDQAAPAPTSGFEVSDRLVDLNIAGDLSDLDPKLAPDVLSSMEDLHAEFPKVFDKMHVDINVDYFVKPARYAETETFPDQASINLGSTWFKDADKLAAGLKEDYAKGWLAGDDTKHIIDHEFGHVIDRYMAEQMTPSEWHAAWSRAARGPAESLYGRSELGERFAESFAQYQRGTLPDGPERDFLKSVLEKLK